MQSERLQIEPEHLPEPTAGLVLWRVSVEAYLSTSGRKRGERFLRQVAETLASEEALAQVFAVRPASDAAAVRQARREAVALFHAYLPTFLARLAGE